MAGVLMNTAIVFVCRGFSKKEDMREYIFPLEKLIVNKFTNIPCYRVFLDDEVRREVFFADGSFVDDMDSCFNLLISRKVKNVVVVPLIPCYGQWYTIIVQRVKAFEKNFDKVSVGRPILDKTLKTNEMMVLEKGLSSSEEAKKRLVEIVGEMIKIRKR